jgi:hypothetical protein
MFINTYKIIDWNGGLNVFHKWINELVVSYGTFYEYKYPVVLFSLLSQEREMA